MIQIITVVYLLSSFLGVGAWGANVYLLVDDDLTLVDTGLPGRADLILEQIEELGYSPSDVKRIIITHHHADHTGSLAALKHGLSRILVSSLVSQRFAASERFTGFSVTIMVSTITWTSSIIRK